MALFLKMKSINESEIQESTSPCASHVHRQHFKTHINFSQTSTGGPNVRENIPVLVISSVIP